MSRPVNLFRWAELPLDKVTDMVARKVVETGETTLTQAYFKKGAVVPLHTHAGDLMIYVLQGVIRARVGGDDVTVREGDVMVVPAGALHQTESLDDTFVLTVAGRCHVGDAGGDPAS